MAEATRYCPNCFRLITKRTKCQYCGYDQFSRTNSMALADNTLLNGRYILGRVLGSGGFGITYKAYDIKKHEICAIKEYIPLGQVTRDRDSKTVTICDDNFYHGKKRFMDEANILQSLNYVPAVVKVFDYFDENNTCYFVMEYIDGMTLNQYRHEKDGRIPYPQLVDIFLDVAECLDVVHKKSNIFHRDVSPENILIRKDGQVRLIDFGNAKIISGMENQSMSIVLKPGFAPPEQYSTTIRQGSYTDVYALASTFYFCLTGERVPTALKRLSGDQLKPIDYYLGEEYRELTPVFEAALRLDAQKRTQTVGQMILDIMEFNARHHIMTTRQQRVKETDKTEVLKDIHVTVKKEPRLAPYMDGVQGSLRGYRFKLPANTSVTVGRDSSCQICVESPRVISKKHFDLFYDQGENLFYLEDHSRNGTYINGMRCEHGKFYWLKAGDKISLANNACVFRLGVLNEQSR